MGHKERAGAETVKIDEHLNVILRDQNKYGFTWLFVSSHLCLLRTLPFSKEELKREGSSFANLKAMPQVR